MAQPQVTALDLWLAEQQMPGLVLPTGCDSIDELLGGGFRYGLLTEVCGEASAGKTQLCLQLLLHCRLPRRLGGLASSACYICTEGIGSIKRLYELAGSYGEKYGPLISGGKRKRNSESAAAESGHSMFLDGIFIEQLYELNGLLDVLQVRLPTLLEEQNTKLVIIDSIAALFRLEATTSVKEASERSRMMFHVANCMRILSAQYQVVFVLTNQVTGNFANDPARMPSAPASRGGGGDSGGHKPALGLSWSNCINQRQAFPKPSLSILSHRELMHRVLHCRLIISRCSQPARRRLEVVMSPYLPRSDAFFNITSHGLTDVEP